MASTVLGTVLAGVLTFLIGQLLLKLVIEPVQDTKRTIGRVAHTLIERANVVANPGVVLRETSDQASEELRRLSSELVSHLYLVPAYDFFARVFRLPTETEMMDASTQLIGLSNSVHSPGMPGSRMPEANAKRVGRIQRALSIHLHPDMAWSDSQPARP